MKNFWKILKATAIKAGKKDTISGVLAVVVLLLLVFYGCNLGKVFGATYAWLQSSWAGGADVASTASHNTAQSPWTKYYSASTTISAGAGGVALSGVATSATETTDADFNAGATSTGYIYVANNTAYPQKPDGYYCAAAGECTSGECCGDGTCKIAGGFCPCSASTACGTSCSYSGLTYGTVTANSQCWMDRNLGATAVATAFNSPTASYGWYFQWGRYLDGHQVGTSGTTATLNTTYNQNNSGLFITSGVSPYDWLTPQNNNLWGSTGGYLNNPCPTGWHAPAQSEWASVVSALGITNYTTAASSALHLPASGNRNSSNASLDSQGLFGLYWSSTVYGASAGNLDFSSSGVTPAIANDRAYGFSVRCLKN